MTKEIVDSPTIQRVKKQIRAETEVEEDRYPTQSTLLKRQLRHQQRFAVSEFKAEDLSFEQKRHYMATLFCGKPIDEAMAEAIEPTSPSRKI